jgi:DNA-binding response OmpR family regulator
MPNVLIVEDDAPLASYYTRILQHNGYTPDWVNSCTDAIHYVEQSCPDVLILDVLLPDGNGFDFLKWMDSAPTCELPAVVVISSGDFKPEAQARGVSQFLTKPVSMDVLLQSIEAAVHDKH